MALLSFTSNGIYCEKADVFIDPWKPCKKALITHAHADHSRYGMKYYLAHHKSIPIMKHRLGEDINTQGIAYGETINMNGVDISFHPAGHIPGSAQIKLSYKGETWVASGDYKLEPDELCEPFEPQKCSHFITESTFGLPIYKWKSQQEIFEEINSWWRENKEMGKTSVILGYSLGKAQRILAHIDHSIGPVFTHGAVENMTSVLRNAGFNLPQTTRISPDINKSMYPGSLVIAPPSALGSSWMKKFNPFSVATASGWMALRGARRRRNVDRGFVLSDHADWDELNTAVKETAAENIYVTHGYRSIFSNWLNENGYNARAVDTEFEGELSEIGESAAETEDKEAE